MIPKTNEDSLSTQKAQTQIHKTTKIRKHKKKKKKEQGVDIL